MLEAGHSVQIPADADPPLAGAPDDAHFAHACDTKQIILTYNPKDFQQLHEQRTHPGILAVYQDNDISRDMSYREIVGAIRNLEDMNIEIRDEFWSLNQFRW